jgi:hypothetical protein
LAGAGCNTNIIDDPAAAAVKYLCLQQNDGGLWPYLCGHEGAIEPSSWAAIACRQDKSRLNKFVDALLALQNKDGGWSNDSSRLESDWCTAAALLALQVLKPSLSATVGSSLSATIDGACARAQRWIMDCRAEHYTTSAKFALLVWKGPAYDYERGWPWTQDTFDWVEPTAYVLLSLRSAETAACKRVSEAVRFGEEFLVYLVCEDGGWNFGDRPSSLMAPNPPDVQSTVLALLALRSRAKEAKISKSLKWLLARKGQMQSISELAWTALALGYYGEGNKDLLLKLKGAQNQNGSLSSNILTQAIACLSFESSTHLF